MALVSPGVEVSVIDESQYLPAPTNSIPFILLATAQNKADPTSTGVAEATTAANAGKLYRVTSQRDLVTLYGNPFFYTTSNGTPIQGYELNEYGLLAAYSALGSTNTVYCLRADIDLASLVGQTGRPSGDPADGTYWLDTTSSTWGIYEFNSTTGQFVLQTPIVITDPDDLSNGVPSNSIGNIGDYAVIAIPTYSIPSAASAGQFFVKAKTNFWQRLGTAEWLNNWPTVQGSESNPTLTPGNILTIEVGQTTDVVANITVQSGDTIDDLVTAINDLGWTYLTAENVGGKLTLYSAQTGQTFTDLSPAELILSGTGTILADLGIDAGSQTGITVNAGSFVPGYVYQISSAGDTDWISIGASSNTVGTIFVATGVGSGSGTATTVTYSGTFYQPALAYGTSAQQPLWQANQSQPRPNGSVWIKVGSAGNGLNLNISRYDSVIGSWVAKTVNYSTSDWNMIYTLDSTGGKNIPAGTIYAQYNYNYEPFDNSGFSNGPLYYWERIASGPTVVVGTNNNPQFNSSTLGQAGPYYLFVRVSVPGSQDLSSPYLVTIPNNADATDFVTSWSAANIPYTLASVSTSGAISISHLDGGVIQVSDGQADGYSSGVLEEAGFAAGLTAGVKEGKSTNQTFQAPTTSSPGSGCEIFVTSSYQVYWVESATIPVAGSGYSVGDILTVDGADLGGVSGTNDLQVIVTKVGVGGAVEGVTYVSGQGAANYQLLFSNWVEFEMIANEGAPNTAPANGTNWFYSVVDEVDIMINTATGWKGYKNVAYDSNGFPLPSGVNATDPNGPLVSATEPTVQSDGTSLVYGDIWIDTSDLENYPIINRWQLVNGENTWVRIDNSDQTSSSGVVFADARWATNGTTNPIDDPIPTIQSLLTSNYLDLDAPDDNLYPVGMLLFNTRRSGYNVKEFAVNYFNANSFPDQSLPAERDAWVSVSGLQANGAPYMGRKAQRAMVVQAMRAAIDTNTGIRDEDNFFNLIACPNYPELQPNMVVLNNDRGETGFIIGDTPMRLPDSATDIQAWATNAAGATTTGEEGLVTRNTYMGLFYPSGLANDLSGNLVAVPASHMMIRTILRNDTIAYPWLAPAGTRRGVIDNATAIGYVSPTSGEFVPIKTRVGIRDVLYTNQINPLVFFTGNGLLNYGNKSSFNSQSALDRINVARLIAYLRRQLTIAARPFVFEPNDAITRQQISGVVETLLVDLVAKRGVYDYLVVCDESNNTPARIDRNELWIDVAIEPVKAIEFIYIPVRIFNTGELSAQGLNNQAASGTLTTSLLG